MISYLTGTLKHVSRSSVVVTVNGIGYEVLIPAGLYEEMANNIGAEVELYIYSYIEMGQATGVARIRLVGFKQEVDRMLFERLISVPKLGVKSALKCLVVPARDMAQCIEDANMNALSKLPGIGRKAAELVVAELRGKLFDLILAPAATGAPLAPPARPAESLLVADARAVLVEHGYRASDAQSLIEAVLEKSPEIDSVPELIRQVYRRISEGGE